MSRSDRVFITGITSIHGWPIFSALQKTLPTDCLLGLRSPKASLPATGDQVLSFCITDRDQLQQVKQQFAPTRIIHCAGICDLDLCEERPTWAHELNVGGAEAMVHVFGECTPIIYMSTDLVFSGENPPDGGYDESAPPDPISVAGHTFVQAESIIQACPKSLIVRIPLPLGPSVTGDKGAVDWIESRFKRKLRVSLFYDEYRSCVWYHDIANMAQFVLDRDLTGLYHFGGDRSWSLYEIGLYVLDKGPYDRSLFNGLYRAQEENGPPRIGDVSLNSQRLKRLMGATS